MDLYMDSGVNQNNNFSFNSLESIRKRLLDLTSKNNLLNYRHPKVSCVRIIDEQPDQIYDLLSNNQKFTLIPVPEPTHAELLEAGFIKFDEVQKKQITEYPSAEQWAKYLGLSVAYELPHKSSVNYERHSDSNLQTLLYETDLESRLRKIRNSAETAIEESGSNILYLALGFLEWYESKESDVARLAPLFTIPVSLDRVDLRAGAYRYQIQIKDDNLITNITLREKLLSDFGYIFPDINDETTPEDYFEQIGETIIKYQPRWKVRRFASLVMLNFTKQVMYQDLNPDIWPVSSKIQDHPIIKNFFSTADVDNSASDDDGGPDNPLFHEEEHLIDQIDDIHESYPLIYDADSSQHSAVIDASNGNNLVVEGPPGTGKSQTITNLIASLIANGKSVLFVAEKMAALNVVKSRLDGAGLGDFCMELHSHKTNKQKILQDLDSRIKNQTNFASPKEIDADIARYEDLKEKLNTYVKEINGLWGNTGLTIHQILHRATRLREELGLNPEKFRIENIDALSFTQLKQNQLNDYVGMLKSMYVQVSAQTPDGKIESHYWYGVQKLDSTSMEIESIEKAIQAWSDSLISLKSEWINCLNKINFNVTKQIKLSDIYNFKMAVEKLPILLGGEQLDKIEYFYANQSDIKTWLDQYSYIHKEYESIKPFISQSHINDEESIKILAIAGTKCAELGIDSAKKISEINHDIKKIDSLIQDIESLKTILSEIQQSAPSSLYTLFDTNILAFEELRKLVNIIQALPVEFWKFRDDIYDDPQLDNVVKVLDDEFTLLNPLHLKIKDSVNLASLPDCRTLKYYQSVLKNDSLFRWLSSEYRSTRKSVFALASTTKINKKEFLNSISDIVLFSEQYEKIVQICQEHPNFSPLFSGSETPIKRISKLRAWYKLVRDEYGIGFGKRVQLGSTLIKLDQQFAMALADEASKSLFSTIDGAINLIEEFAIEYKRHPLFKDKANNLHGSNSSLSSLQSELLDITNRLLPIITDGDFLVGNLKRVEFKLKDIQKEVLEWKTSEHVSNVKPLNNEFSIEPSQLSQDHIEIARNNIDVAIAIKENQILTSIIEAEPNEYSYQAIVNTLSVLNDFIDKTISHEKDFKEIAEVNIDNWIENTDAQLDLIIERNNKALENISWLNGWIQYNQLKHKLYANGLSAIVSKLEAFEIQTEKLDKIVSLAIYNQLANEILKIKPSLSGFAGIEQTAIQETFKSYDRKLIGLQRKKVAFLSSRKNPPQGVSTGRVSQLTELSLIQQEISKKKRHIAVRSLLKRSGEAIKTLKPCFMMSPMSVAQYLEPGKFVFDLVVMDEASQIRPEDAIGAIARGAKLVVVGDPKQLPPTSFFNASDDAETETDDETVTLQVTESILETVSAMPSFKKRILKWHYRSRHESLIAFSNKHFYDSKLIVFPSPFKESNEYGVKLHFISRGRFAESGSESSGRNVEEAAEVVKAISKHLINNPQESLGIVAMNSKQKDEIEKQLDFLAKNDLALYEAIQTNKATSEPLFIKNLENVQGDERDIIFISMTYGPNQSHGRVMQRFGPLNQDVGWRRLNVLFTRSKKRMHIFSSMKSGDILIGPNSSRGVIALRNFLEFAETGHLYATTHTGKDPDSDFEIAVMNELHKHGYECEPQLGVAGFYIDLAVKDPGKPGKFILGIECDGATYHSAKSARDRDRLRQEILEGLGWNIKRIWSTDWFKHPQSQLQPILNELQRLRSEPATSETEIVEVFEPTIQEVKNDTFNLDSISKGNFSLAERLVEFDKNVISQEFPKTHPSKKLLRREMIDQLIDKLPTSKAEFQEFIPRYLRTETENYEAKFLDDVLKIILEYS